MNKRLLTLLLALFLTPAYAKEGVSLLTPQEAEAVKAALPKTPSVPWGLAEATDEQLWDYVPPASLRRAVFLGPTDVGCPIHGPRGLVAQWHLDRALPDGWDISGRDAVCEVYEPAHQ